MIKTDVKNYPISDQNKQILIDRANSNADKLKFKSPKKGNNFWDYVTSYFPDKEMVSTTVGKAVGNTYSQGISNTIVDRVVRGFFSPVRETTGVFSGISNLFTRTVQNTAVESMKMGITPYLAPMLVPVVGGLAGGTVSFGIGGIVLLLSSIYGDKDPKELEKLKDKPLNELIKYDPTTDTYSDAYGRVITSKDIQDLTRMVKEHEIICSLVGLKRGEIQSFVENFLTQVELKDGTKVWAFKDGQILSPKKLERMKRFIEQMAKGQNFRVKEEDIQKFVSNIAKHSIVPSQQDETDAVIGTSYTKVDGKKTVVGYFIRKTGDFVSEEEYLHQKQHVRAMGKMNRLIEAVKLEKNLNKILVDFQDDNNGGIKMDLDFLSKYDQAPKSTETKIDGKLSE